MRTWTDRKPMRMLNNNQRLLHKVLSWMAANEVEISRMQAIKIMFFVWYYHKKGLTTWRNGMLGAFNYQIIDWLEDFTDQGILEHSTSLYNYSLLKKTVPFNVCDEIAFMFRNWRDVDIADYSEDVLSSLGVKRSETTINHSGAAEDAKIDPREKKA